MKKQFITHLLMFIISINFIFSQENNVFQNKSKNTNDLDVEDKIIEMIIDSEKIDFYLTKTFKTLGNVNQEKETQTNEEAQKPTKIQALKIAYISSKLNLKVEESEKFWPVYNEYVEELKKLKDITSEIEKDEKVLAIRKKYKENFDKIIGEEKSNTLYKAEKEFKKLMQETLIMQKLNKDGGKPQQP